MKVHWGEPTDHVASSPASATVFERSTPNPAGYHDVTTEAVHDTLGSVRIIDVREPREYWTDIGHIEVSHLVPLAELPETCRQWDTSASLVLVCRSGGRSGRAASFLVAQGFRRVMNMVGGLLAWDARGLPIER